MIAAQPRIPLFERLLIESQSSCNRSCWFCPRTYDRSGKYLEQTGRPAANSMPTEQVLQLLDQAQALGFRGPTAYFHYSEPLLDKRHLLLADAARKRGMQPFTHTNGDVLKHDPDMCSAAGDAYALIIVGLYDYRTNEELEQARASWRNRLAGANLKFSPIALSAAHSASTVGIPRALVPSDARFPVPDLMFSNAPCHRPLIRMTIQHDGEMCLCCEDTYGAFALGNAYQHSLEELWFSARHIDIVEDLLEGRREKYELCRQCPLAPSGPAPGGTQIGIAPRRYSAELAGARRL
jgi:radical SAM protein with 4Fe4S-binding SPASM domain